MKFRIEDFEFLPEEYEKGKTRSRLEEAIKTLHEMGNEIENMTAQESKDYHWYIVGVLIAIISALFIHMQIHMDKQAH